ncbi:MAG: CopG family transcriptional regulator [Spirochaetaceae bacterium]|nr:MAG: CopG family transcriptional regulator [Spirochaetaceae bacterium]
MTAEQFDELFDRGEDISPFVDSSTIKRPGLEARRVNVDFPEWIIRSLDQESKMIGVSRQSLIKLWISERLQEERRARSKAR